MLTHGGQQLTRISSRNYFNDGAESYPAVDGTPDLLKKNQNNGFKSAFIDTRTYRDNLTYGTHMAMNYFLHGVCAARASRAASNN